MVFRFGVLVVALAAFVATACSEDGNELYAAASDGDADGDGFYTPTDFYRQCTDARCELNLTEGERIVQDVPTWHDVDTGFRLDGDPAVISTIDEYAAHPEVPVQCYVIQILGRWGTDVSVTFEASGEYGVFGMSAREEYESYVDPSTIFEGESFFSKPLPHNDWQLQTFELKTLSHRGQLEFSLRKSGAGEALFYFVEIDGNNDCSEKAIAVD
ncbi:MAG: hypothetical protein JXX29_22775 [Deltaproteobacteria bacterium]|nr:hypothetical protein [Deltaproteobacteria bacterium]MBN2674523.1 hypothetical protein [Deltaproteobacteria bacterium]